MGADNEPYRSAVCRPFNPWLIRPDGSVNPGQRSCWRATRRGIAGWKLIETTGGGGSRSRPQASPAREPHRTIDFRMPEKTHKENGHAAASFLAIRRLIGFELGRWQVTERRVKSLLGCRFCPGTRQSKRALPPVNSKDAVFQIGRMLRNRIGRLRWPRFERSCVSGCMTEWLQLSWHELTHPAAIAFLALPLPRPLRPCPQPAPERLAYPRASGPQIPRRRQPRSLRNQRSALLLSA
jgi:hypothetical protein